MTDESTGDVRLTGHLVCADLAEAAIVTTHLPDHVRLTLAEPGCLSFRVWQTHDPLIWAVEEQFVDAAAFAHHQARTRASAWWAATRDIARRYTVTGIAPG